MKIYNNLVPLIFVSVSVNDRDEARLSNTGKWSLLKSLGSRHMLVKVEVAHLYYSLSYVLETTMSFPLASGLRGCCIFKKTPKPKNNNLNLPDNGD